MNNKKMIKKNTKQKNNKVLSFMRTNASYNPNKTLEQFAEAMDKNAGKELSDELCQDHVKVSRILGLDTHVPVAETVTEKYRTFLVKIIRDIEKEHNCTTAIEKSLAEIIGLSHVRILHLTTVFDEYLSDSAVSKEKTAFYTLISKELDRAHRQLNTGIARLTQLKTPALSLNVNAKTALFAQNQQIHSSNT